MSNIDYYAALGVAPTATATQIREAYKRAALKTHPDRVSHDDPARATRTKKFQEVNDAYFVLSDPVRRRDYDATRRFSNPSSSSGSAPHVDPRWQEEQFSDVFEEMMREEGLNDDGTPRNTPAGNLWSLLGGIGGATLGFIVGNFPGLLAGAVAGNRLGAVRDKKGKSVYEAFQELPQGDKAKVLSFSFDIGVGSGGAMASASTSTSSSRRTWTGTVGSVDSEAEQSREERRRERRERRARRERERAERERRTAEV